MVYTVFYLYCQFNLNLKILFLAGLRQEKEEVKSAPSGAMYRETESHRRGVEMYTVGVVHCGYGT